MTTKYIVNNATGQTITGSLTISGKTSFLNTPPTYITGSTGDKQGELAFDNDYLYYCTKDFVNSGYTITSSGASYTFGENPSLDWNSYYSPPQYSLQIGYLEAGDPAFAPQTGWYIVDDNYEIKQVISGFNEPNPQQNGAGWLMTMDGPFNINSSRESLTFYETLPTVTFNEASGDIWKSVKLDAEKNTTAIYRALLTQTGAISGTSLGDFKQGLIIGETYLISNYVAGDDFSNIANVISGNINETGCEFIATGETPTDYSNGSQLVSSGGLIVDVLENSLGYDIDWAWAPFGGYGYYVAINDNIGPVYNNVFPRQKVEVLTQLTNPFDWVLPYLSILSAPANFMGKDNVIIVNVFDMDLGDSVDNALYYTPVEIRVKQDNTPVIIDGTIETSYPINNTSIVLKCNGDNIETYYSDIDGINNLTELVNELNGSTIFNFLGVFSDDGEGGIQLTMKTDTKNLFCQDNTLTFEVFND